MAAKKRILFIAWEFTLGGAALLALRHMRRLISFYEIDFLITGPADERMLSRLPAEVGIFRLEMGHRDSGAYFLGKKTPWGRWNFFCSAKRSSRFNGTITRFSVPPFFRIGALVWR